MHPKRRRQAFTLIELLVVIAVIAILSVVVILTLNPAELLRQSRDSSRISDMSTIAEELGLYNTDQGGSQLYSLGTSSTIYVSLPDPSATSTAGTNCASLGLPTLPGGYIYHCAASSTYRNVNGIGWIPVNFSAITSGSSISRLPVDPINASSSYLYYTYETNGTQFEVTSVMESKKYGPGGSGDVVTNDGASLANTYAKGSNLALEPLDYGGGSIPAFVQAISSLFCNGCATSTATFGSNTTAGNFIIATIYGTNNGAYPTGTISDTQGDTFTLAASTNYSNGDTVIYTYYAANIKGGADSVSFHWTSSDSFQDLAISEYSGIATNPVDQTNSGTSGFPTASVFTGNVTTTASNELLYSFVGVTPQAAGTITVSSGWTERAIDTGNTSVYIYTADKLASTTGSYANTFTLSGFSAFNGAAQIVTFK